MPMKPLRPCKYPGCRELTRDGYCKKHKNLKKARGESERWHYLYLGSRWKRMRSEHLLNEPFCRECAKKGIRTKGNEVDHLVPHRGNLELFFDKKNLQTLCKSCHSRKTMAELKEKLKNI